MTLPGGGARILTPSSFRAKDEVFTVHQGLRSLHSLNPWLFSCQPAAWSQLPRPRTAYGAPRTTAIFSALSSADGESILPGTFGQNYKRARNAAHRKRVLCDYIAGMTDRFAIEYHGRLYSDAPVSVFKRID
jgi:dGTP triphosphohydrolase